MRPGIRTRRIAVVLGTVIALFVSTVAIAMAYWSSSGTATGSATTATLQPPTNVSGVQTPGSGTVAVSWTASTGTPAPTGYYVVRNDGSTDSPACGTSAAAPTAGTACNDLVVPIGNYTYKVVAVYHTWTATSAASASVAVVQAPQMITFSSSPVSPVFGGTYTVSADGGGSGNPVTFTSATPAVCTVSGATVSFVGTGSCTINADQAGSTYFSAAPTTPQTFTVGKASQTITFPIVATGVALGTGTAAASASSGLPITYNSTTPSVCTISGTTISYLIGGTCTITADQPGNSNYNPALQVSQNIGVNKVTQTITAFSAPTSGAFGGTGSLSGTASSGLAVTFSSNTTSVCTVSGSTVTYIALGTCTVQADQPGNGVYGAAAPATMSFTVGKASQTINWTSQPSTGIIGGSATLTATATSGLSVAFTSSTTSVCTVTGTTVHYVGSGSCTLNADQAGNATYFSAPTVTDTFTVNKQSQTITFNALGGKTFGNAPFTVSATASSGQTVTFTSATLSVCTTGGTNGSTVTIVGGGTCTINADQAGNATFAAAPTVQQSFAVAKANQNLSFTSTAPVGKLVGGTTYTATATATPSGLPVTITSATPGVCTITGSAVSFVGAGTCTLNANQAGDTNYNAATQVTQGFSVGKGNQTITFTSINPTPVNALSTYNVSATATSGLTVAITIDATTSTVCSIVGNVVTFNAGGTCKVNANQAGDGNWNAATQVQQSIVVNKIGQTISFTSTAPPSPTVGGPTYTATATSTSGLTVAITSGTVTVCTISGSTVSFVGAGTCTLNANQGGNGAYNAATQVQQSFTVTVVKLNQTITFTSTNPSPDGGGDTYTPTATASPSGLAVTFTVSGACSIASGVVTFAQAGGTCTISANQAGNGTYNPAPQVQQIVTVDVGPSITNSPISVPKNGSPSSFTLTGSAFASGVTVTGTGAFTVSSFTFVDSGHINVTVTYGNGAKSGTIVVTNPDGGTDSVAISA